MKKNTLYSTPPPTPITPAPSLATKTNIAARLCAGSQREYNENKRSRSYTTNAHAHTYTTRTRIILGQYFGTAVMLCIRVWDTGEKNIYIYTCCEVLSESDAIFASRQSFFFFSICYYSFLFFFCHFYAQQLLRDECIIYKRARRSPFGSDV